MENILATALGHDATPSAIAEKRDLLDRFVARLAHEIRNPLSSLDIHFQLLEEDLGTLTPGTREQLTPRFEIIHGELRRLTNIVENFLRLTRPSDLDPGPVEIPKIINHVCELMRPEAAAREIEIQVRLQEPLPVLMADGVRLTQALLNLVINGLQAVERNGRIEVEAVARNGSVVIEVRDNGPGIPPEKQGAIFDPYFTTKAQGNGLGLWIAQQIVSAHGGTLQAQNAPQGGAIFALLLPIKASQDQAAP